MNLSPELQGFLGACAGLLIVIECVLVTYWLKAHKENAEAAALLARYFDTMRAFSAFPGISEVKSMDSGKMRK